MKETSFELELQAVFLSEAEEMLESTEAAFIAVETDPADMGNVDKIFRLIHTVKGSAHVAGFPALGQFAHVFETLLDSLRKGTLAVTSDVVDVLLSGNDCLKHFVTALRHDPAAIVDTAHVVARIEALASGKGESRPVSMAVTAVAAAVPEARPVSDMAPELIDRVPSILICDDEPAIVELMECTLNDANFTVHTADSARRALAILATETIDVVVTDLRMPEMDGIEFIRQVRAVNQIVPVIFVSGHIEKRSALELLKLGVLDVIEKPFEPEALIFAVQKGVYIKTMRDAVLSLSRQSFRAFVALQRLEAHAALGGAEAERAADKLRLDESMAAIQMLTMRLLESERLTKA